MFGSGGGGGVVLSLLENNELFRLFVRFTDVAEVIQAIRTHPDAEMSKCVKIGAVTCCVDPLNTFMEHR